MEDANLGPPQLDQNTQPQEIVPDERSPQQARAAIGEMASALLVRGLLSTVATLVLLVAAVWLFRRGITVNRFPAFLNGADHTDITRYSGPWIAAAFGAALVAALTLTIGLVDLVRRVRLRREV